MPAFDRRAFLAALVSGTTAGIAGCSSSCPDSDPPTPSTVVSFPPGGGSGFRTLPGGSWPAPRGDPGNTGYAAGHVPTDPSVRWRVSVPVPGSTERPATASSPVVADDAVFVATGAGAFALALRDGRERWHGAEVTPATTGDYRERVAPPRVGDRRVYLATTDGVAALRLDDGTVAWRRALDTTGTPALAGDAVVVPTAGGLHALAAADGRERWTASLGDATRHPAVADGTVVAAGDTLGAFDAADGRERWRLDVAVEGRPVVADGTVFLGTSEGVVGVGLADGRERWTVDRGGGRSFSTPVVTPETVYAVERPGEAGDATFAFDRGDTPPSPRWCSYASEGAVAAATDDHALARQSLTGPDSDTDDGIVAFTARFGAATWGYVSAERPQSPALLDGGVVTVDRSGTVAALGGSGR